jgi:hypothetical protein
MRIPLSGSNIDYMWISGVIGDLPYITGSKYMGLHANPKFELCYFLDE